MHCQNKSAHTVYTFTQRIVFNVSTVDGASKRVSERELKNQIKVNKCRCFFYCTIFLSLSLSLALCQTILPSLGAENFSYFPASGSKTRTLFISIGIVFHFIALCFSFFSFFGRFLHFYAFERLPMASHRHGKTTNTMSYSNEYISWNVKKPSF